MPTLVEKKNISIHFFPQRTRALQLSTENGLTQFFGNGHQSAYSRADIIFFSLFGKKKRFVKFKLQVSKIKENY